MNTFLTPSSIAAELRPDLDPEEACEIYTGAAQPPVRRPFASQLLAMSCASCARPARVELYTTLSD